MTKNALNRQEADGFAQGLSAAYLRCRTFGHDQSPHSIRLIEGEDGSHYYMVKSRCSHKCGVKWEMEVSLDGDLISRRLNYSGASGYLSKEGRVGSEGRSVLRKHYLVNGMKKGKEIR